jgi:CubicO group peptidase (beta-lactamase class C family)
MLAILSAIFMPAAVQAQTAELVDKLEKVFEPWNRSDGPGGVVGIVKDGELIFSKGYGLASVEHSALMRLDSILDIGSVSKQFTAMSIYLLEEEGKLSVDDDVQKHIPELPTFDHPVKIHELIHHTSGIRDYFTLFSVKGWNPMDTLDEDEVLQLLARQQDLNFEPSTKFMYCNTGYFLLARIVERASGKTLGEYAEENIFKPLGMESTKFDESNIDVIRGRAMSYRHAGEDWAALNSNLELVGDGALHTTIFDMAKWHDNLAKNKLGKGSPDLVEKLMETAELKSGRKLPYAGGLFIDELEGVKRVQHGGDWLGFNAMASWFPDENVSVFTFGNDGTQLGKSLNKEAALVVLADVIEAKPEETEPEEEEEEDGERKEINLTGEQVKPLIGRWKLKLGGLIIKITRDGRKLMAQATGQPAFEVYAETPTKFFYKVVEAEFEFKVEDDGEIKGGTFFQNGLKIPFERLPDFEPTEDQIKGAAGSYYSSELSMVASLKIVDGKLELSDGARPPMTPDWIDENQLSAGGMTLDLVRAKDGTITGMLLQAGRAVNLKFEKLDIVGG